MRDYQEWPYGEIDERSLLAAEFAYQQVCFQYCAHIYGDDQNERCSLCDIDGLCVVGTALSKRCFELRETLESATSVILNHNHRLFDRFRAWIRE